MTFKLAPITWCPGCSNFGILTAVQKAVNELGIAKQTAIATGIGCHGKIFDYLPYSGIYCLHGRTIPTALGIKFGNPNLKVLAFAGDGDTYAEGMGHFIHACRYNMDITLIVHNNQTFSLTTGQPTPTSESSYKDKTMKTGSFGQTINPIKLALISGATFVARTYALDIENTTKIIKEAINHKGFSFVEILQPCIIFHDTRNIISKNIYKINSSKKIEEAIKKADEYKYDLKGKIPVGIFWQDTQKPTLENQWPQLKNLQDKKINWRDL